jgi:hypothetical protein
MTASIIIIALMLYHVLSLQNATMRKVRLVGGSAEQQRDLTAEENLELKGLVREYFIHLIGSIVYAATFTIMHMALFRQTTTLDETNYSPICFLIAGFYCCITIVAAHFFTYMNKPSNIGLLAIALGGCYLVLSAVNHYSFFSPLDEKAGITFVEALNSADLAAKVTDIQCETILFVRDEGDVMKWRCPSWIYGDAMSKWPLAGLWSYKEGESRELKLAIEEIKYISKKPPYSE